VVIKVLGVCADVTQLELYKRELELQLEKANNSNLELEQFAYIASHDLQEPLRKITAFGERLEKNYKTILGDDGQFYLNRMTNAAQRMNILIEDLLKYSRASRKTEDLTKISLNDVLKNVLEVLELKINEKKAIVKIASLPSVEAQPTQMLQLFQNLIENALKFSQNEVQPMIEIDSVEIMGGHAQQIKSLIPDRKYYKIRVIDNGIGFEPKNKEKIFTIFQRLHGRSEYEGTGICLAICRKIVEANGGKIIAESDQNQGAVFIIYLPI
jgi:light-regulated signal transduction histidine kinase (bacteriophytochrome)